VDAPRAVTFDFWNTLMVPDGRATRAARVAALGELFAAWGLDLPAQRIDVGLDAIVRAFDEAWAANRQFTAVDAARSLADDLMVPVDTARHEALTECFASSGLRAPVDPAANIAATLATLRDAGVRIGIICDVGLSPSWVLRSYLEHHDLLRYFDHWSFSDEVGVYKPDGSIFAHALAGLGIDDPAQAAHVGDLRRTDVAGALAHGLIAVRYRGVNDDHELGPEGEIEADHVIDDHAELPLVLGVG
jgi:FMN phosphatase YigB (HAD superfamily)